MRVMFVCSVAAALTLAAVAEAAPPQLKGQYAFTGTAGCLVNNDGFDPVTFQPINDRVISRTFAVEGIRTFDGKGGGTVEATEVGITPPTPQGPTSPPPPPPSADSARFSFAFTYEVNDDGTWNSHLVPGSFQGVFLQGPRTGQTFTVDKIELTGLLTNTNKVLTAASTSVVQETVVFSNGDVRKRVCHRARTLSWIGE